MLFFILPRSDEGGTNETISKTSRDMKGNLLILLRMYRREALKHISMIIYDVVGYKIY